MKKSKKIKTIRKNLIKLYGEMLDYKSLDIRENILLLNNADVSDADRQTILNDLPKQVKELKETIYKYKIQKNKLQNNAIF